MARQQVAHPTEPGEKDRGTTRVDQITKRRHAVFDALSSARRSATLLYYGLSWVPMADMTVPKVPEVDTSEEQGRNTPQGANSETKQINVLYIHLIYPSVGCKISHNRSTSSGRSNRA